jgi:tRNA U34 5-methylaminomethyl-2-thiouridine-forming methyltransferase MnmC
MEFADVVVEITEDGSNTLRSLQFDSTYHSHHGAFEESEFVFIHSGLDTLPESSSNAVKILEVGFGSGLNALLAWQWAKKTGRNVEYVGIEAYPVNPNSLVNFESLMPNANSDFQALHTASWNELHQTPNFNFTKLFSTWPETKLTNDYDIVFFDAFSPVAQPEMWNYNSLKASADVLKLGGIWVTYCAKGEVRRTMNSLGFNAQRLPGPPNKRHILHAIKTSIVIPS